MNAEFKTGLIAVYLRWQRVFEKKSIRVKDCDCHKKFIILTTHAHKDIVDDLYQESRHA